MAGLKVLHSAKVPLEANITSIKYLFLMTASYCGQMMETKMLNKNDAEHLHALS